MTGDNFSFAGLSFPSSAPEALLKWDGNGKLVFVHPTVLAELNRHIDVRTLELLALLESMQRECFTLGARVLELEQQYQALLKPVIVRNPPPPPVPAFGSVEKLIRTIEENFKCYDGDHSARHTCWSTATAEIPPKEYPYVMLGAITSVDTLDAREFLRQRLWTAFHKLRMTCTDVLPVLYWRYAKECRIEESEERSTDGSVIRYKIKTRIAIPEAGNYGAAEPLWVKDGEAYPTLGEVSV